MIEIYICLYIRSMDLNDKLQSAFNPAETSLLLA